MKACLLLLYCVILSLNALYSQSRSQIVKEQIKEIWTYHKDSTDEPYLSAKEFYNRQGFLTERISFHQDSGRTDTFSLGRYSYDSLGRILLSLYRYSDTSYSNFSFSYSDTGRRYLEYRTKTAHDLLVPQQTVTRVTIRKHKTVYKSYEYGKKSFKRIVRTHGIRLKDVRISYDAGIFPSRAVYRGNCCRGRQKGKHYKSKSKLTRDSSMHLLKIVRKEKTRIKDGYLDIRERNTEITDFVYDDKGKLVKKCFTGDRNFCLYYEYVRY